MALVDEPPMGGSRPVSGETATGCPGPGL